MRWRPWMWLSLSMLCFVAAVYFWHLGNQWAAEKAAHPANSNTNQAQPAEPRTKPSAAAHAWPLHQPQVLLSEAGTVKTPSVAKPQNTNRTSQTAYRLSNTKAPITRLMHSDTALLLQNALIDTANGTAL